MRKFHKSKVETRRETEEKNEEKKKTYGSHNRPPTLDSNSFESTTSRVPLLPENSTILSTEKVIVFDWFVVMSTGDLLNVQPSELKFPFELKKQSSCSMQLSNKTDKYVAFKVKTTNPRKYCVRPNAGIVLPRSICNITVTMQSQKEAPPDMQCKDKFLLQSVSAPDGATAKDITPEMFNKEDGKVVEEFKLRVVYIPANPPSPVPEESEEGSPSSASAVDNVKQNSSLFDSVSRSLEVSKQKSSEAWSMISKLTEEKALALQENQKLLQELELASKEFSGSGGGRFSVLFVVVFGLLGVLIGCFIKKT